MLRVDCYATAASGAPLQTYFCEHDGSFEPDKAIAAARARSSWRCRLLSLPHQSSSLFHQQCIELASTLDLCTSLHYPTPHPIRYNSKPQSFRWTQADLSSPFAVLRAARCWPFATRFLSLLLNHSCSALLGRTIVDIFSSDAPSLPFSPAPTLTPLNALIPSAH